MRSVGEEQQRVGAGHGHCTCRRGAGVGTCRQARCPSDPECPCDGHADWCGRVAATQAKVAVKSIPKSKLQDLEAVRREIAVMGRLRHKHIIRRVWCERVSAVRPQAKRGSSRTCHRENTELTCPELTCPLPKCPVPTVLLSPAVLSPAMLSPAIAPHAVGAGKW